MARAEMKNSPSLLGWVGAAMMALVGLVALIVVGGFDLTPAVAIAAGVFVAAGLVMGMPRAPLPGPGEVLIKTPVLPGAAVARATPAPVSTATPPTMPAEMAIRDPIAVAAAAAPATAFVAMVPETVSHPTSGPVRMSAPRGGVADDLKEIEGIGPALETVCNDLGFYHFDQIAHWTDADIAWVDDNMPKFKGRIVRDRWVPQARLIMAEGLEAFRIRAKTNNY